MTPLLVGSAGILTWWSLQAWVSSQGVLPEGGRVMSVPWLVWMSLAGVTSTMLLAWGGTLDSPAVLWAGAGLVWALVVTGVPVGVSVRRRQRLLHQADDWTGEGPPTQIRELDSLSAEQARALDSLSRSHPTLRRWTDRDSDPGGAHV